jgi:hypothetical protein
MKKSEEVFNQGPYDHFFPIKGSIRSFFLIVWPLSDPTVLFREGQSKPRIRESRISHLTPSGIRRRRDYSSYHSHFAVWLRWVPSRARYWLLRWRHDQPYPAHRPHSSTFAGNLSATLGKGIPASGWNASTPNTSTHKPRSSAAGAQTLFAVRHLMRHKLAPRFQSDGLSPRAGRPPAIAPNGQRGSRLGMLDQAVPAYSEDASTARSRPYHLVVYSPLP